MRVPLPLLLVLVLIVLWCLVNGAFTVGNVLAGCVFGALFVLLTRAGYGRALPLTQLPRRLFFLCIYLFVLIPGDVIRSNAALAWRLLRRQPKIRPGIARVSLGDITGPVEALEEHAITLTPGQLIVDYSEDGRTIYVHLIDVTEVEEKQAGTWRTYRKVLGEVFG
jgi:multicomponent Na+:H+ antiporter subunit E